MLMGRGFTGAQGIKVLIVLSSLEKYSPIP